MRLIDYISRSEARAAIAAARDKRIADKPYGWEWEYNGFNAAILALPMSTEDLVPVVRCRECKWWERMESSPLGYCHACKHGHYSAHWEISIRRTYPEDWFCADAERKEKDGDEDD